jgi:hypothetical protein
MASGSAPEPCREDVAARLQKDAHDALAALRGTMFENRETAVAQLERKLVRLNHYLKTGEELPED